jgi:hypothetical protein
VIRLLDWDAEQWRWAAEAMLLRGEPLPSLTKPLDAAVDVQTAWQEHRLDEPSPPRMVLTNSLGQVFQQTRPCAAAVQWVNRMLVGVTDKAFLPYTKDPA